MKIDVDDPLYDELRGIEARIKAGEGKSVEDRWEFGHALLQRRDGKQLPTGVRAAVAKEHGISRSEVGHRMRFAETFARDEVANAVSDFGSWRGIVKALSKRETAAKPKPAWDERISKRLNRIIDDAETEDRLKTLAELFRKALERVEPSQEVAA
jgi:hypothetical protein